MKLLYQGAEAHVYVNENSVLKRRISKSYRDPTLDASIIKKRTKREVKIIKKLNDLNIPAPSVLESTNDSITMTLIKGDKLRDVFDKNYEIYAIALAKLITNLHKNDIIHGDLTTSNMILSSDSDKIHLIDFGLSFISKKIEDFAVDLHLFCQALESTHHTVYKDAIKVFKEIYVSEFEKGDKVLARLDEVELRGRYKHK